jgi:hypothetical protein
VASKAPKLVQRTATGTVHAVDDETGAQFLEIREPYDETAAAAAAPPPPPPPLQAVAEEQADDERAAARASTDDADADALLARLQQLELDEEAEGSDDSDDEDEVCSPALPVMVHRYVCRSM